MSGPLSTDVAFVTGASRGLGRAIAEALADAGAAVVLAARSQDEIDRVAYEIRARGGRAIAIRCDVLDAQSVNDAVAKATGKLGAPDILVNNAGVMGPIGPIGEIDPAAWWQAHAVHVLGALHCMHAVLPGMVRSNGGRIINIASQAGTFVAPHASAYAVAKSSLLRLSEHVDAEQRAHGIRTFAIQPGTILTDMSAQTLSSQQARQYAGPLVALLESVTPEASDAATRKLQTLIVDLAVGRFDPLSGRYLDVDWDLPSLLEKEVCA